MKKRIGLMTGGGDAPGLNGIIESVVRGLAQVSTQDDSYEVVGIHDGFDGVFEARTVILNRDRVEGAHRNSGTLLGTSNKTSTANRIEEFKAKFSELKLDGLIAAGGDGTFQALGRVVNGLRIIGVPKTIDNDLSGTDLTFGFDTACSVVAGAVDDLRHTADAHKRVMIVETMGRTAGWIALAGGLASFADAILIPERGFSRAKLLEFIKQRANEGRRSFMLVASEGVAAENEDASIAFRVSASHQAERYGGFAEMLARWVEKESGWESRHLVLGHLQRAKPPTVFDRLLTQDMGLEVARMVQENDWNKAVVYRGGRVTRSPLNDLMQPPRLVTADHPWVRAAQELGIFI